MKIEIDKVKLGDEQTLAYIQTESWKYAFKGIINDDDLLACTNLNDAIGMYRRLLENNIGNGYIMKVDDKAHCIAWWDKTRDGDIKECAELICIHSLPDMLNRGCGSMMMQRILNDIKNEGYKKVSLWVFVDNNRARRFYEKHQFVVEGKTNWFLGAKEIRYIREIK